MSRSARGFVRQKGPDFKGQVGQEWPGIVLHVQLLPSVEDLSFPRGGTQPEPSSSSRLGGDSSETSITGPVSPSRRTAQPGHLPAKATGLQAKPASHSPLALSQNLGHQPQYLFSSLNHDLVLGFFVVSASAQLDGLPSYSYKISIDGGLNRKCIFPQFRRLQNLRQGENR